MLLRDPVCRICGKAPSVEADHRDPRGGHELTNLQGVCGRCHRIKTQEESLQARGYGAKRKREVERHPGAREA